MDHDFLERDPIETYRQLLVDDKAIRARAEEELKEPLSLLDDVMVLVWGLLWGLYSVREQWLSDSQLRATIAMSTSAFNSLLLARHAVLQGYYYEAQGVLRDCWERVTRALLFQSNKQSNKNLAEKFWRGERLNQASVDKQLSNLVSDDEDRRALEILRSKYGRRSELTHPNLESFVWRTPDIAPCSYRCDPLGTLADKVGKHVIFGGLLSKETGRVFLADVTTEARMAAAALVKMTGDGSPWQEEYRKVAAAVDAEQSKLDRIYEHLRRNAPTIKRQANSQ